ncbi:hypothetical protein CPAST_c24930 [Clostridium pasteurianum DSM 525 = ATCC 6013]|uniref:Bacteriocin n=1 Tax=Clostridium pasteurianum DSM 525 = ATCC 6013 TaxID=1262449 RepID=A0A0H3J5T3_CLOPA|nr:hypothetical protein [Clostridium pasteurianum]AJA48562.1 hypothetical protein CPAST_c24930 [Clostridium pasteurianum DSM 525 = ATCC 6013]AJA52550.1 hypothetical protein CLPA_c24930 [Clostridium pasteurianum DSM 525 = ATCC 6013]AOZ75794.1 hypothetical protein AQ983_12110 [Clostridium pasteurianum DSM 525 = ATCC 6013]AOZ79590.1 hypothetical protein AQ984_12105 [Clostridium pasteurianum]ELP57959.1 hypothetical protein F502_17200 [Clostridium pasteurianum DSM 525 = ATCC 6013]
MKKSKKIIAVLALLAILVPYTNAKATTDMVTSAGHSFNNDWEASVTSSRYKYIYGYNTSWINEDYVHAIHYDYQHDAAVSNGGGGSGRDSAGPNSWAKIEITHKSSAVNYGIIY